MMIDLSNNANGYWHFVMQSPDTRDGLRYFANYSLKRVVNAWSLAGSRVFIGGHVDKDRDEIVRDLYDRGYKLKRVEVI